MKKFEIPILIAIGLIAIAAIFHAWTLKKSAAVPAPLALEQRLEKSDALAVVQPEAVSRILPNESTEELPIPAYENLAEPVPTPLPLELSLVAPTPVPADALAQVPLPRD